MSQQIQACFFSVSHLGFSLSSQMLLHLHHYALFLCAPPRLLPSTLTRKNQSFYLGGDNETLRFNKTGRNISLNAMDKDSDFEVDPDKAREALRKLDEQLQSLSEKKVNPPKIRATDVNLSSPPKEEEGALEISGSFLAYAASVLLIFSIVYNILFLMVIKPSVDGP